MKSIYDLLDSELMDSLSGAQYKAIEDLVIDTLIPEAVQKAVEEEKIKFLKKLDRVISGSLFVCKKCGMEFELEVQHGYCNDCLFKSLKKLKPKQSI